MEPITDKCRKCGRVFEYDTCTDEYVGALEVPASIPESAGIQLEDSPELTLYICPEDGTVFAMSVTDELGCDVFVPTTQAL